MKEILNNVLRNKTTLVLIIGNKYYSFKRDEILHLHCNPLNVSDVYNFALTKIGNEYQTALEEINGYLEDMMFI